MVVVDGDSTRTSDSTMLMPRKREAWSHVTTPLIETDSIRCMRQPVPCTTPRLRRGRARGCPPPRSMRRPIHYLNLLLVPLPGGGACARIHALLARSVLLCHVTRRCLLFFFSFFFVGAAYIIIKTRGLVARLRAGLLGVFGWDNHRVLGHHLSSVQF